MQQILLGVTGGISAYKSVELVRRLKEAGAYVRVIMTEAAKAFITPLTFQAVSEETVYDQLLDDKAEQAMSHITLARWADQVLIAPASADFIARLAHGHANDLLTTVCLATHAPIIVAPAMNRFMWENAATQNNVALLLSRDIRLIGPNSGTQACGDIGPGRMAEPLQIVEQLSLLLKNKILQNKHILMTAGPTREPIDPVRYISNKSSGKMGYELARAALALGAHVTLISGPTTLPSPEGIKRISVETASQMYACVMKNLPKTDIFIAAAAVADYHVETVSKEKLKKTSERINLNLIKNPDILASVAALTHPPFTVGFAAETEEILKSAKNKLSAKKIDLILANDVSHADAGFDSDMNAVNAIWNGGQQEFPLTTKKQLAKHLIELIAQRYYEKNPA